MSNSIIIKNFLQVLEKFKKMKIDKSIDFELMNEILISHHSTAIEGSSLTEEETLLLLTEGITAKGKPLQDHNMVKDHQEALLKTIELARQKKDITPEMIQRISALVMKTTGGVINAPAGAFYSDKEDFRKNMVHVGARYFVNYQNVPQEVAKLCLEINNKLKIVKTPEEIYDLAFDAHFYLVSIHPFADGNGRVSRLVMNYILEYYKQPLAIINKKDKLDYYKALEESRKDENINLRPLRNFMYEQQSKYLTGEIQKVETAGRLDVTKGFNFKL
jgi:Fic family protein